MRDERIIGVGQLEIASYWRANVVLRQLIGQGFVAGFREINNAMTFELIQVTEQMKSY